MLFDDAPYAICAAFHKIEQIIEWNCIWTNLKCFLDMSLLAFIDCKGTTNYISELSIIKPNP